MRPRRWRLLRAGYGILVGAVMVIFWAALYATGQIPELATAPYEMGYHLGAELLTAAALVVSGVGVLRERDWGRRLYPVALGLLLYTVLNSAGYYAQLGEFPMVGMFTVLTVATLGLLSREVLGDGTTGRDGNRRSGIEGEPSERT